MQTFADEIIQVEPDAKICTTEQITSELSKCYGNNNECKYGLYAGKTCTYCLHPDHRKFLKFSN
jgi:hypothetical protein